MGPAVQQETVETELTVAGHLVSIDSVVVPIKKRGGARPGAGRKSRKTRNYQHTMLEVVQMRVTPDRWARAIDGMLDSIESGNAKAFAVLAPYVMGAAPKDVQVTGAEGGAIEFTLKLGERE